MAVEDHRRVADRDGDGSDALVDLVGQVVTGRVHDADRVRTELDGSRAPGGQPGAVEHVAHEEHYLHLDPTRASQANVPLGDVDLGAVRTDPHDIGAETHRATNIVASPPPRSHEHAHPAVRERRPHGRQHHLVGKPGSTDLNRGGSKPVPVPDLDHRDPRPVSGLGVGAQLRRVELMGHRVLTVAQRRVVHHHPQSRVVDRAPGPGDAEHRSNRHARHRALREAAYCSPSSTADAVMISTLPA